MVPDKWERRQGGGADAEHLPFTLNDLFMKVDLSILKTPESRYGSPHIAYPWRFDFKSQSRYCIFTASQEGRQSTLHHSSRGC